MCVLLSFSFTFQRQLADGVVVIVAARNGLFKDGWIGGHTAQPVLFNELLQFTRRIVPRRMKSIQMLWPKASSFSKGFSFIIIPSASFLFWAH